MRSLGVRFHAGGEAHAGYGGRGSRGKHPPPNILDAAFPRSSIPPSAAYLRVRGPRTDSCGTSGGAQCCCGQLILRRWQRRRPASPRRRQGANRVPAGSWDAGRAGAALREAGPGQARPPGPSLLPQPGPAATSSPVLRPLRPLGVPQGWAGRSGRAPLLVAGQPERPARRATGLCRADTPRSLPAAPPPSRQPRLCSRGRPVAGRVIE